MNNRLDNLQILRAAATCMIFLSHSSFLLGFDSTGLGAVGVSVFIVLSGFLTSYNHYMDLSNTGFSLRESIEYARVRMKKFYLLHVVTFVLALILDIAEYVMYDAEKRYLVSEALKAPINLLLLQSYIPDRTIYFSFNSVSWYLSTIVFFYLCTPFIIKALKKIKMKKIYVLAAVYAAQLIITLIFTGTQYEHAVLYINPLFRVLDYTVGIIGGAIFLEIKARHKNNISSEHGSIGEIAIVLSFIIAVICYSKVPQGFAYCVFYTPFSLAVIFMLSFNSGVVSKIGNIKLFSFIGTISLEIFMLHQLVVRYLVLGNEYILGIDNRILWVICLLGSISLSFFAAWLKKRNKIKTVKA